ncbi:MAG: PIN domain nuclease [Proteobacteria bacterium]|nr:PIN domain nuclease [Pseudomonadota bacterium]
MILVDSSVWIDYLRGVETRQTDRLHGLLGIEPLAVGDLIMTEVLQGLTSEKDFKQVRHLLESLDVVSLGGQALAIQAARNFRTLREQGITVRKTIDCTIATRCIMDGMTLLHGDRDFDPFVTHLGLKSVFQPASNLEPGA